MDSISVARKAGADGLSPAPFLKNVLNQNYPRLPVEVNNNNHLFSSEIGQALLHEAIRYSLRSISHLISYEAIHIKRQFSWALVTLYYSNYFSILSLNRLAGQALSTTNGKTYEVTSTENQSNFNIKRVATNNHKSVWMTNYDLYYSFNWIDSSYNGIIVQVDRQDHYERKNREFVNYHPDSYNELFFSKSKLNKIASYFGKNYLVSPGTVIHLPFADELEETIANLECRAVARQILIITILREVAPILQPTSRAILIKYFSDFSRSVLSRTPFTNSKLKSVFQPMLQEFLNS